MYLPIDPMKRDAKYRPQKPSFFRPTNNSPFGRHCRFLQRRYLYSSRSRLQKRRFNFIIYYIHFKGDCQGYNATIILLFRFLLLVILTANFYKIRQFQQKKQNSFANINMCRVPTQCQITLFTLHKNQEGGIVQNAEMCRKWLTASEKCAMIKVQRCPLWCQALYLSKQEE